MSAPTPWTAMSTPMKLGLRCSSLLVIAKIAVSRKPTTLSATASEIAMRRSIGVRATWWNPAEISARKCSGARTGLSSRTCNARTENPAMTNVADIQDGDPMTADDDEESGAHERRDQSKTLANRSQEAVGVAELLRRQQHGQERGLGRTDEVAGEAVEEHREVDDPHVRRVVDEEQQHHQCGTQEVHADERGTSPHAVDHHAGDRREERGQGKEEEGQAGLGVRVRQLLDPDAEGEEHRGVAEEREALPDEIDPRVTGLCASWRMVIAGSPAVGLGT